MLRESLSSCPSLQYPRRPPIAARVTHPNRVKISFGDGSLQPLFDIDGNLFRNLPWRRAIAPFAPYVGLIGRGNAALAQRGRVPVLPATPKWHTRSRFYCLWRIGKAASRNTDLRVDARFRLEAPSNPSHLVISPTSLIRPRGIRGSSATCAVDHAAEPCDDEPRQNGCNSTSRTGDQTEQVIRTPARTCSSAGNPSARRGRPVIAARPNHRVHAIPA